MSTALFAAAPLVEALGWTLLHFVWQALIVGVGFALTRALFARHSCDMRYATGLAALAVLAICPALTLFTLLHRQLIDAAAAQTFVAGVQGPVAETFTSSGTSIPASVEAWLPWMVLAWVVGVLLVALRALHQWRVLARIARDHSLPSVELESTLAALARRFRFVRRIRVLVSEHIDTPTLIGWLKPVILLPTAVALGFPRQQVELILAHELGHLRRYDHVVNLAQALLETLFFYHPVVHWISNEVRNEREICCDALVLRVTDGEPCEYARTLAALEELRHEPAARFALAASGGVLLERVRRIVGMPATGLATVRPNFGLWVLTMAGLTVAFAAVLKVDRSVQELELSSLSIDWLPARSLQALPLLALGVQQHRPRLELAAIVAPPPAISVTPASTAVATGPARPVGAGMPASDHMRRPAVTLPSAIAGQAPEPSADALASASAPAPDSQVEPARVSTVAASVRPTAIRVVTPAYPRSIRSTGRERVEVGFAINGDGSVRDITVADNGFDAGYGRAATSALRQWRFDPATVSGDHAARYTQTFVFAQGAGRGSDSRADEECVQSVGSHICRRPDEGR